MKLQDLRATTPAERAKLLREKRLELDSLRSKVRQNQLKQVRQLREARRTIAQLLTLAAQADPAQASDQQAEK